MCVACVWHVCGMCGMCVAVRDDALLWHHAHVDSMRSFLLVPPARSHA